MNSNSVHITKASELDEKTGGQTEGMIRKGAVINKSSNINASVIHHHGNQDTIVYSKRGYGSVVFDGGESRKDLSPGDFALIPAYAKHQEVNDGEEETEWIIHRSPGGEPIVQNLSGWDDNTGQPA